jgi:hypothetical protein
MLQKKITDQVRKTIEKVKSNHDLNGMNCAKFLWKIDNEVHPLSHIDFDFPYFRNCSTISPKTLYDMHNNKDKKKHSIDKKVRYEGNSMTCGSITNDSVIPSDGHKKKFTLTSK